MYPGYLLTILEVILAYLPFGNVSHLEVFVSFIDFGKSSSFSKTFLSCFNCLITFISGTNSS
jgi:hypothetical protein